jgi:branched-chain amino acid transport system substrate-binding protein
MLKKSVWRIAVSLLLVFGFVLGCAGCAQSGTTGAKKIDKNKTEIVIGAVRSQTGANAIFDQTAYGPCYRMWVSKINKDGGIYVKDYDKKLPVRLIVYDDTSDMGTMTQMYQKLILEDKVDFLLPPCSTAFLAGAAPIAAKYGYLMIGAEGGSKTLRQTLDKYPDFFTTLSYSETQIPAQADLFKEMGVKTVYICYIQDSHGIEYNEDATTVFKDAGLDIVAQKSLPPDLADMTPIINDAKASGADAFVIYSYPQHSFPAIEISKAVGYNPKVFLGGPGTCYDAVKAACGGDVGVEGLMFEGAWNTKSSPELKAFAEELQTFNKDDPKFGMDWWGHAPYYAGLEVLQQAIEKTGTLDQKTISAYIKANHFTTVMGDTFFTNQELDASCYKGQVGQWQNGYPEVVDVGKLRTAQPIYPKPEWAQ